uniref:Uncharacterized protein n=1 Tax=Plectus sambesii TaxID=2011161 RepID=A0A914VF33_9BILA
EQRDTDFCEQITCVLRVACFSIDLTEVENVKVADLIWLSMSTLQHLAADDVMFRRILILMKSPDFAVGPQRSLLAPLFVLSHPHCNENIQRSALGLLNELTTDQEIAALLLRDQNYVAMFDHFANSQIQANATYAIKLLEKLNAHHQRMSGGVNDRP